MDKLIVDCSTGSQETVPLSEDEMDLARTDRAVLEVAEASPPVSVADRVAALEERLDRAAAAQVAGDAAKLRDAMRP